MRATSHTCARCTCSSRRRVERAGAYGGRGVGDRVLVQLAGARQRRHLRGVPAAAGARIRLGALAAHQRLFDVPAGGRVHGAARRYAVRPFRSARHLQRRAAMPVGRLLPSVHARQFVGVLPVHWRDHRGRRGSGRHGAGFGAAHALVPRAPVDRHRHCLRRHGHGRAAVRAAVAMADRADRLARRLPDTRCGGVPGSSVRLVCRAVAPVRGGLAGERERSEGARRGRRLDGCVRPCARACTGHWCKCSSSPPPPCSRC